MTFFRSTRTGLPALALVLLAVGCDDSATAPRETGEASIEFVTYPGEVEPGNVAVFELFGWVPTPCHELTGTEATLDDGRVELSARWTRNDADACPVVIEPFETAATLEVPAGFDSLAVSVDDSVWDHTRVLVDAPGFKKAAGTLTMVGEVEGAPGCHRGTVGLTRRFVFLDADVEASDAFVVGRLDARVPAACADTDVEDALGTLELERVRSTSTTGGG